MAALDHIIKDRLDALEVPLAVRLPSGQRLGRDDAEIEFHEAAALTRLATGNLGALGAEIVHGNVTWRHASADAGGGGAGPR